MNFVGSISKTLFGTLDTTDMKYIDKEFDQLYHSNQILANSISNQTRILRTWLNSASHDFQTFNKHSQDQVNSIINATNLNQQNLAIANYITTTTIALNEVSEDVNLLINAVNEGKHGIVHPQLLTPTKGIAG